MTAILRPARPTDENAVRGLLEESGLQPHFVAEEFLVYLEGNTLIGCGRLRPLADGSHEIASVAVATTHRGHGLATRIIEALLARADGPVYGLSLAPALLTRHGFVAIDRVPEALRERAEGACGCYQYAPMALLARPRALGREASQ